MAGGEMEIALDGEAERQPHGLEFGKREAAELGAAEAEVGQTEEDAVGIDLGRQPGRRADGAEQAHDGRRFGFAPPLGGRRDPGGVIGA